LSVRNFFEEGLLDEIVRVKPDELAPSLGAVILAIGEGRVEEGETPYYKPSVFFELTYPSDNFISVLKSVVEALRNRGFTSIFLNLDMGSGKTHLLTLLLHLFASYTLAPKQLSDYLDDYKSKTGYDENLARKTVVFAFDLRTPRLATRYLTLTERLLRKLGSDGAAELVKSAYDHDKLPDANELAKRIDKELNLLILIDELHYAATLGDEEDKRIVAEVVKFVLDLVNYRRTLYRDASGIAIVVASSRRDFNRWLEIRDLLDPVFRASIEGFIDQMQRIESTAQTRWLSLDETKRVLEKRLGLRKGEFEKVFHKSFDKFIERVVKADSDVPQAHHLRSLIKAMAIYALEAYRLSDGIVSPAHFTEDVIDVLLPGSELANGYKSIYGAITGSLESSAHREEVLLAVNSIFSLTITGAPEKLVEMVRVAKTRTPPQDIPVVREVELREILKVHRLSDPIINEVVEALDTVHPNIHRVSLAGEDYGYFVVPIASVLAIFRKMISDEYKELMGDPIKLAERICKEDLLRLEYSDDFLELKAIESLQELEKKPHSRDKFYVYVYVNGGLLTQLSEEKRTKDDSFNTMKMDAKRFLESKGAHNLVIVLPRITKEALEGKAYSLAVDSAASYVINEYIAPLEKGGSQDEIARKLLEIELSDLKAEMGRRLNDALAAFTSSLRSVFAEALYYTPKGVMSESITIDAGRKEVKIYEIQEVSDTFRRGLRDVIADASKALADRAKQGRMVLPSSATAVEAVYKVIEEDLKKYRSASFRVDEPRIEKFTEDRWIYIPAKVMEQISGNVIERVENAFKDKYKVSKEVEEKGKKYKITVVPITQQTQQSIETFPPPQPQPQPSPSPSPWEALNGLIDSLAEKGGMIWVKIEVSKESAERIKKYLSLLKDYIKESKEATEQAKGP
jgi:Predicted ATPase (AAA+ superfamily)